MKLIFFLFISALSAETIFEYNELDDSLTTSINSDFFSQDKASYCRNRSNPSDIIWSEDFSNPILDSQTWSYSVGNAFVSGTTTVYGWGNNEKQYYRDQKYSETYTSDNLFIEDGFLKIQPMNKKYRSFEYTSARINTNGKKTFSFPSKITFCFKVPTGTGLWPAFWLLPTETQEWPSGGEIDIMEAKGRITNIVSSALHYGNSPTDKSFIVREIAVPTAVKFQDKFHSITLEWREDSLKFFLDNETDPYLSVSPNSSDLAKYQYPFNEKFYLIINLAIGGLFDDNKLDPSALCSDKECSNHDNPDSRRFLIDWIEYAHLD